MFFDEDYRTRRNFLNITRIKLTENTFHIDTHFICILASQNTKTRKGEYKFN